MIDKEKVIKGLTVCTDHIPGKYNCNECPYEIDGNDCELNMAKDALALLKEQDTQIKQLMLALGVMKETESVESLEQ